MKITFTCPAGHRLKARPDKAGSKTVCPACGAEVVVPRPKEPAAAAAERPSLKRPPLAPSTRKASSEAAAGSASSAAKKAPPPLPKESPPAKAPPLPAATTAAAPPPPLPPVKAPSAQTRPPVPPPAAVSPALPAAPAPAKSVPPPAPVASSSLVEPTPIQAPVAATTAAVDGAAPAESPPPSRILPTLSTDVRGYQPDRYKLTSVYWLALALVGGIVIQLLPVAQHYWLPTAPAWTKIVLFLCVVQLAYIAWMVSLADWSTVWTMMLVYAVVSATYGFAFAVTLLTPRDQDLMFELEPLRRLASLWCAAMVLLTLLAAFLCGRTSSRWHRAYMAMVRAMAAAS